MKDLIQVVTNPPGIVSLIVAVVTVLAALALFNQHQWVKFRNLCFAVFLAASIFLLGLYTGTTSVSPQGNGTPSRVPAIAPVVATLVAHKNQDISKVFPEWYQSYSKDVVKGDRIPDADPSIKGAGCLGVTWNINDEPNVVVVFGGKTDLRYTDSATYFIICNSLHQTLTWETAGNLIIADNPDFDLSRQWSISWAP